MEVKYQRISRTQDTGDSVIKAEYGDSNMTFIVDSEENRINVWYVASYEKGDMKTMLDHLMSRLPTNEIIFIAPMSDEDKEIANEVYKRAGFPQVNFDNVENDRSIRDALHGFSEETIDTERGEVTVLKGQWDSAKS